MGVLGLVNDFIEVWAKGCPSLIRSRKGRFCAEKSGECKKKVVFVYCLLKGVGIRLVS